MAGMFSFHTREAVRVKVKKCEGHLQSEYRKFSVDPQITSFEVLQSLLTRAFDVKGEFTISYLARDDIGQEIYFSLLSDWDLDAAFLGASQPCLRLKVDVKPFDESLEEWDIIAPVDFPIKQSQNVSLKDRAAFAGGLLNKVGEKTLNLVQKALNLVENQSFNQQQFKPLKAPMSDAEFHNYLDSDGRLIKPIDLRLNIYKGGLESGLRKVVWKHILNVYPEGLSGAERVAYMKRLSKEYYQLRETWQKAAAMVGSSEEMQTVINLVRKDVLRTDRSHKFYAGLDDNKNVVSLFSILTTYALNHPSVSYCQGMSDLASPLLVTMKDEGHAYVCFCALMKRLKPNFMLDGRAMTLKFQHLTEVLQMYDTEFYEFLQSLGADDLLFCYRWLLLELKREFAFDDALRMLEVLWSSLPYNPPEGELEIFEIPFEPPKPRPPTTLITTLTSASPKVKMRNKGENPYTKVRAMRRQSSGSSCSSLNSLGHSNDKHEKLHSGSSSYHPQWPTKQASFQEGDTPNEVIPDYLPISTAVSRELRMELDVLDREIGVAGNVSQNSLKNCSSSESKHEELACTSSDSSTTENVITDNEEETLGEQIRRITASKKAKCKSKELKSKSFPGKDILIKSNNSDNEETFLVNGEIIENEDEEDVVFDASAPEIISRFRNPHLKSVIPIKVVRERLNTDPTSVSSLLSDEEEEKNEKKYNSVIGKKEVVAISEGYITDEAYCFTSSLEVTHSSNSQNDSGVPELENFQKHQYDFPSAYPCSSQLMTSSCEEVTEYSSSFSSPYKSPPLPPPTQLGGGNPFMIFLCLTILLQHRDHVMKNRMDYNETAMHFDRMVRRHNVNQVLHQARFLFSEYMRERNWVDNSDELTSSSSSSSSANSCKNRSNDSFNFSNVA